MMECQQEMISMQWLVHVHAQPVELATTSLIPNSNSRWMKSKSVGICHPIGHSPLASDAAEPIVKQTIIIEISLFIWVATIYAKGVVTINYLRSFCSSGPL